MANDVLLHIANKELQATYPTDWEPGAFNSFAAKARIAFPQSTDTDIQAAWRDALAVTREENPSQYKEFEAAKNHVTVDGAIPFSDVELLSGNSNGEMFILDFKIREIRVTLEISLKDLLNVHTFIQKLKYQTFEYIEYPEPSKKRSAEKWEAKYVFPWLKSGKVSKEERYMFTSSIEDAIISFCAKPIDSKNSLKPFLQTEHAVRVDADLYIPFTGCETFARRVTGKETSRESVSSVLKRLGAECVRTRHAGNRKRWWKINENKLYEIVGDGEPGEWKNDITNTGSKGSAESGWKGIADDIRSEEQGQYDGKDGLSL